MLLDGCPGVYLQEVPSGVRTIVAASTSTLALVAHFPRGPVGVPVKVTSWDDVLRNFGGLDRRYIGLEALRDFFSQGGSYAWVSRIAFERPTVMLTGIDVAFIVEAKATGAASNGIKISIASGTDGSFAITIDDGTAPVTIPNLSADPASPRFVERIVNASSAEGGSDLVQVRNTRFVPEPIATASAAVLAGGGPSVRASVAIASVELPAVTLQGLEGWTNATRVTAVPGTTSGFKLTFSGLTGPNIDLDDLTIAPGANYLPDRLATAQDGGKPVAAVVIGRHPMRQPINLAGSVALAIAPTNANAQASAVGQPGRASKTISRPVGAGPGSAMQLRAISPGEWGNNLRIGIAATASGFDLMVNEYRGEEVVASETYRNLSIVPTDAQFGRTIVNEQSRLVEITSLTTAPRPTVDGKPVDDLNYDQLSALTGGGDGTLPGEPAWAANAAEIFSGAGDNTQGIGTFDKIKPQLINLMAIPEAPLMSDRGFSTYARAGEYCREALAFLLVDHPEANDAIDTIGNWDIAGRLGSDLARSAAICFPRLQRETPVGKRKVQSSGAIAGLMARTDAQRGVWKAPAGLDASVSGALPSVLMTDRQQSSLNRSGINCLRVKPGAGTVQWGARTLAGADILASEWKYVPVRRTALMIEQTLRDALGWVVFEPNDESLWAQVRLNVGSFMQSLFVQGAFQGTTPREAYLVKCDGETTSQQDVNSGVVNILVGFAPLKPAEFVVLRLTQLAGRLAN